MRIALAELTIATFLLPCALCAGQPAPPLVQTSMGPPATSSAPSAPATPGPSVSQILQPGLDSVQGTLGGMHVDKWKKGGIRDEANQNISQIMRDVQANLPPLIRDADSAPGSVSKMMPVSRNVGALYDVLLRVVEASRVVAPDDQVAQLQQALVALGNARLALIDRMQASADALEKQVVDLRGAAQRQPVTRAVVQVPIVLPCASATVHRTTKKTAKPAAGKPAGANNAPATPTNGAKPNANSAKPQQQ